LLFGSRLRTGSEGTGKLGRAQLWDAMLRRAAAVCVRHRILGSLAFGQVGPLARGIDMGPAVTPALVTVAR